MKAGDVMTTKAICINVAATVSDAAAIMLRERISGLPVVDDSHTLVGIVTEGDFLRRVESSVVHRRPRWLEFLVGDGRLAKEYVVSHSRRIAEVMTREVISVTENTPLERVVELMETKGIKRVPVLHEGRVVGIVSRANLLQVLARPRGKMSVTDRAIHGAIRNDLDRQPWHTRQVHVAVQNGVVTLSGLILVGSERDAIRVVAENVPGVKAVRDQMTWIDPVTGTVLEGGKSHEMPMPGIPSSAAVAGQSGVKAIPPTR